MQVILSICVLSSSGGPAAAKFAGNQLVNLLSILNNPNEPTTLKMVGNARGCCNENTK